MAIEVYAKEDKLHLPGVPCSDPNDNTEQVPHIIPPGENTNDSANISCTNTGIEMYGKEDKLHLPGVPCSDPNDNTEQVPHIIPPGENTNDSADISCTSTGKYKFINKANFENFFFAFIIINAIMMGIGTFDFVTEDQHTSAVFYYCDLVFLCLFTIELGTAIFYWKQSILSSRWLKFDFVIIGISWIVLIIDVINPSGKGGGSGVQVVRSLRIFRLLVRVESWKAFLNAVGRSLPRLGCLAIFTFIIMFIFAVFFTEQYKDMYKNAQTEVDYFSRLDTTFFTMYQLLTLDDWINVLREVMETYPLAWIPFLVYINLASIIVVNLVIAIICDSIFAVLQSKEENQRMIRRCKNMDNLNLIKLNCQLLRDRCALLGQQELENAKGNINGTVADGCEKSVEASALIVEEGTCSSVNSVSIFSYRESLYNESNGTMMRNLCGDIVNHKYVQRLVIAVIFVNTILLALSTFDFVAENPSTNSAFNSANVAFLILYTIENAMQLIYLGPRKMFSDGWLTFDFTLIVCSWALSLTPAFRIFRILRLMRVIPKFEAMRTITGTLYAAIPKVSATAGILSVVFYVSSVMFTNLFKDFPVGGENGLSGDYFSRLDKTLLTLFQLMTMEDWASISRELTKHKWWAHYLVSSFLTFSGLLFVNAIIALFCEAYNNYDNERKVAKNSQVTLNKKRVDSVLLEIKVIHDDILILLKARDTCFESGDSKFQTE